MRQAAKRCGEIWIAEPRYRKIRRIVRKEGPKAGRNGPPAGWERADDGGGIRIGDHALDGLNPGNWAFREGKAEGNGSEQFAVDINRAAAHALQNASVGERTTTQTSQNDPLFGGDIFENTEYFDLELFDAVAGENSTTDAVEAWLNSGEREEVLAAAGEGRRSQ